MGHKKEYPVSNYSELCGHKTVSDQSLGQNLDHETTQPTARS